MTRIIGLSGKMGSGKDTVADILVSEYGYTRIAFADALKREVEQSIRHQAFPDGLPLNLWEVMLEAKPEDVYAKPTPEGIRILLQFWGSDYRRGDDPLFWIRKVGEQIHTHPERMYVISDVRFKNEADYVRHLGGEVWMVERKDAKQYGIPKHASERLTGISTDRTIPNHGTLEDLRSFITSSCVMAA